MLILKLEIFQNLKSQKCKLWGRPPSPFLEKVYILIFFYDGFPYGNIVLHCIAVHCIPSIPWVIPLTLASLVSLASIQFDTRSQWVQVGGGSGLALPELPEDHRGDQRARDALHVPHLPPVRPDHPADPLPLHPANRG